MIDLTKPSPEDIEARKRVIEVAERIVRALDEDDALRESLVNFIRENTERSTERFVDEFMALPMVQKELEITVYNYEVGLIVRAVINLLASETGLKGSLFNRGDAS